MQSSAYNNPMFAQGLSGLVQSFIGNPGDTAKNEVLASQALLNNQTAQYRDAIGDTGMSGDLASMMVRALQAGPEYSGNAPKIGDAAIRMGSMGFGSPELTPQGPIAGLIMQSLTGGGGRRRGGGGGGGSGGGAGGGAAPAKLTQSAQNRVARMVREGGYEGAEAARIASSILEAYSGGGYPTLDQAAGAILPGVGYEDVVTGQEPDRWWNPFDGGDIIEQRLNIPNVGAPAAPTDTGGASSADEANILNQAREALARNADPAKVTERLVGLGIDPSKL